MRSYQPFQQNMVIKPNKSIAMVIQRFKALDLQNKELLKLAENVQRSSFVVFNSPPPQIIRRLQQELRRNLSILIDSIRQVFIDMDKRLRALAQIIEQQPITQNSMRTQYSVFSSNKNEDAQRQRQGTFYGSIPNLVDPYSSLVQRISSLQINLKNTQQNQAKLISIIQKLQRRREQQPTITSELKYQQNSKLHKEFSDQLIQKSMIESSGFQTSFRLFSLQTQYQGQYQNQNQNKLKAREKESVTMAKQKKSSPKSFVCFGAPLSDSLDPSRISPQMPQINYEKNYASTHSHRLNFMINTLNS